MAVPNFSHISSKLSMGTSLNFEMHSANASTYIIESCIYERLSDNISSQNLVDGLLRKRFEYIYMSL